MRLLTAFIVILLLFTASTQAQISSSDAFIGGGFHIGTDSGSDDLFLNLSPITHYFISKRFTIGGSTSLAASFDNGLQGMVLAPRVRYYFNPEHLRSNWFAFLGTTHFIDLVNNDDFPDFFEYEGGLGLNTFLSPNVVLESTLSARLPQPNGPAFFTTSHIILNTGLTFFLGRQDKSEDSKPAQNIAKGSWMIGGSNADANFRTNEFSNGFNINLNPNIGYFISDHVLLGFGIPLSYDRLAGKNDNFAPGSSQTTITVGLSPLIRIYPGKPEGIIRPFINLEGSYRYTQLTGKGNFSFDDTKQKQEAKFLGASGGINVFITPTAALEAGLFFKREFFSINNETRGSNQVGLRLGFQFFLPKKGE